MQLADLQQLIAIAETGSLVRAAERLGVSQPTLSKAVARIERAFRVKLIERLARGVQLTPAGHAVVARMRNIDTGIRDMFAEVRDLRQGKIGFIRFGVGTGIPPAYVSAAVKPLLADGQIRMTIVGGRADSLLRSVRAGDFEFAITVFAAPGGNLTWHKLFADPMVPITTKNHALARAGNVTWSDLAKARWMVPDEGTVTRNWFDAQFRERGLKPPEPIVSLNSVAGWAGLGSGLDCIALLPASTLKYLPVSALGVMVRPPKDWHSDRAVGLVYRREGYLSAAALRLIESLKAQSRSMFAGAS